MSIIYAPAAKADLASAIDYLAQRNPQAAELLQEGLEALLVSLDNHAFDGPEQTLKTGERVRSWPLLS
jgi:plasmid stabilization system protein ParE